MLLYSCAFLPANRDGNGNGYLSLAEIDGRLRSELERKYHADDEGKKLWRYYKPCFIRAVMDAADSAPEKKPRMAVKSASGKQKFLKVTTANLLLFGSIFVEGLRCLAFRTSRGLPHWLLLRYVVRVMLAGRRLHHNSGVPGVAGVERSSNATT